MSSPTVTETPWWRGAAMYQVYPRSFFDNATAYALGYRPDDGAEDHATAVLADVPPESPTRLATRVIGGAMAEAGFTGDMARIEDW